MSSLIVNSIVMILIVKGKYGILIFEVLGSTLESSKNFGVDIFNYVDFDKFMF